MKRVLIALLFAAIGASATAAWEDVGATEAMTIYADKSTIRRSDTTVKMWYLLNLAKIQIIKTPTPYQFRSSKMQSEFDCVGERSRILYYSDHGGSMGAGDVAFTWTQPHEWLPIPPNSAMETLWKVACKK